MQVLLNKQEKIEKFSDLLTIFYSGCKKEKKLGLEFEKLPVKNINNGSVSFLFDNGILDFLNRYKEFGHYIPHYENNFLLGLITNSGAITLEPGCQVEFSIKPQEQISDIENSLNFYNRETSKIANELGFSFLGLGCQPISTFNEIKIIPKERYSFMTKYLKTKGEFPYVMMRETAGVQLSIDYETEEDAILKLATSLKLTAFISAFYSNSPIRNGKLSGYKSFRANSWLNTDNDRCGLISKKLFEKNLNFSFEDYTNILLSIPMIFNKNNYLGEVSFSDFLNSQENVSQSDWENHLSLFFPDVRLKNYIEIRNHDSQKSELALSIPALYKGILYSKSGIEQVNELLKRFEYFDFEYARQNAPKYGMDFSIKGIQVADIVKEIFDIAFENLKNSNSNEEKYLEPALELIEDKYTPADILIKNFEGSWNKNINKLIEYSKIK